MCSIVITCIHIKSCNMILNLHYNISCFSSIQFYEYIPVCFGLKCKPHVWTPLILDWDVYCVSEHCLHTVGLRKCIRFLSDNVVLHATFYMHTCYEKHPFLSVIILIYQVRTNILILYIFLSCYCVFCI